MRCEAKRACDQAAGLLQDWRRSPRLRAHLWCIHPRVESAVNLHLKVKPKFRAIPGSCEELRLASLPWRINWVYLLLGPPMSELLSDYRLGVEIWASESALWLELANVPLEIYSGRPELFCIETETCFGTVSETTPLPGLTKMPWRSTWAHFLLCLCAITNYVTI